VTARLQCRVLDVEKNLGLSLVEIPGNTNISVEYLKTNIVTQWCSGILSGQKIT